MDMRARRSAGVTATAAATTLLLSLGLTAPAAASPLPATSIAAASAPAPLTNTAHLDALLDETAPVAGVPGHTTYRLDAEPVLMAPWTYADARDGGTFERIGGGTLDPATGYWSQGAFNADDISRAAVVYLRHWRQTGDTASRERAYGLLRTVAYLQTTDGPDAGNVVLWMQPDGTLNPSADPVELPDPSDSGPSYWSARAIWAFGEGYAAFRDADPAFAAFLQDRLALSISALNRDVLVRYGQWAQSDGVRVPTWLIVDGADASAEAVHGLAARVQAAPGDSAAATALRQLAEGIAALSAGDARTWPYGALLPWAQSTTLWHAWGAQMTSALAAASAALGDPALLEPARKDAAVFTPTLLTAGGPDNAWAPTPTERVQIAYGADARVQGLLAVADATGSGGVASLAGMQASWFFGGNHAGARMYDPATGVTFDGLAADGTVNRNSGAESTIHGLLTMLALDAHPDVAALAAALTSVTAQDGLRVVEAESASDTDGTVLSPEPWTGESSWSGGGLRLTRGQHAVFDLGPGETRRQVQPVVWSLPGETSRSGWRSGRAPVGWVTDTGPEQGVSAAAGVLRPLSLALPVSERRGDLRVDIASGTLDLDALLVLPVVSRLRLGGSLQVELLHSAAVIPQTATVGIGGRVAVYDRHGDLVRERRVAPGGRVILPPGGFAIVR